MTEVSNIWPTILAAVLSAVAVYIGFINKMRTQIGVLDEKVRNLEKECDNVSRQRDEMGNHITVLEEKTKRLEQRQDAHSKKNDEIIALITDFKMEVVKELGNVSSQMVKLSSDIDNFNRLVTINDTGIKFNKEKKG